jgi:hypothetical protein
MSKMKPRRGKVFAVMVLLLVCSSNVFAKASFITLSALVKKSPIIIYGKVVEARDSSNEMNPNWVSFEASEVVKGPESLSGQTIYLCNSPPPMRDYPDLSKMIGSAVVFLAKKPSGCFDLTHTYISVIAVRDDRAMTYAVKNQPHDQPLEGFFKKVRSLAASIPAGQ